MYEGQGALRQKSWKTATQGRCGVVVHSACGAVAGGARRLSPFGVDGAVDKHGAQCCRPGMARPAGDRSILDQRRRGYARRTWMRLWTTSGALAAAQCRRGLAASGCFLSRIFSTSCGKAAFAALCTGHCCPHRRWIRVWTSCAQLAAGHGWRGLQAIGRILISARRARRHGVFHSGGGSACG